MDNTLLKIRMVLLMGNDNDFVVKYGDHDKVCVAVDVRDDDNEDVKVLNLNLSLARNVFLNLGNLSKTTKRTFSVKGVLPPRTPLAENLFARKF